MWNEIRTYIAPMPVAKVKVKRDTESAREPEMSVAEYEILQRLFKGHEKDQNEKDKTDENKSKESEKKSETKTETEMEMTVRKKQEKERSAGAFIQASRHASAHDKTLLRELEPLHAMEMHYQRCRAKVYEQQARAFAHDIDRIIEGAQRTHLEEEQGRQILQQRFRLLHAMVASKCTFCDEAVTMLLDKQRVLLSRLHDATLRDTVNAWYAAHRLSVESPWQIRASADQN